MIYGAYLMRFRRFTTYLLVTNFTFQSCLPLYAMQDIGDVKSKTSTILKLGAVPARLDFKADSEQTAAGCLFYARRGDAVEILLGLRDDENSYCNPGGKSDKQDGSLNFTAAREAGEETFGIYSPHPEILKAQPFVDLYSLKPDKKSQEQNAFKPFLNRMYFVEQEHVDEKHFNDRLKNAASLKLSHHQQEYRSFTWVPVEDILAAVQSKTPKFINSNNQLEINLFGPLFDTFLTHTAQSLLQHLVTNKTIPQFSSKKKPLIKNQLHLEGILTLQDTPEISWELPNVDYGKLALDAKIAAEMNLEVEKLSQPDSQSETTAKNPSSFKRIYRKKDVEKAGKDTFENTVFPPLKYEKIEFGQDAFGHSTQERTVAFKTSTEVQKVIQDPLKNRMVFGKAVAAKAATSLAIQDRFNEAPDIEKQRKQFAALKKLDKDYFEKNQNIIKESKKEDWEEKGKSYFYKTKISTEAGEEKIIGELPYNLEEALEKLYILEEPKKAQLDALDMMISEKELPTLSDLLLQVQLDVDHVKPKDPQNPDSRRQADLLNLKKYHEIYGALDGEYKRGAIPLDTDFERVADILEIERQYKDWIPMHHASKPEVKYFWVANTRLRELLALKPMEKGTNPGMRATDIYFRGYNNIKESVEKAGTDDYEMGNANRRLSTNLAATSGRRTTHTSSSSIEYFFDAHSVLMPATLKRFEESTQLLGMIDTSYRPYQSLYEQFFGLVSKDTSNSAWTILLLDPDILDTYCYPAHGGGKFFNPDYPTKEESSTKGMQSSIAGYQRARRDLLDMIRVREMSTTNTIKPDMTGRLVESIGEMRLLLHPSVMFNSNNAKVFSVDRFPVLGAQKKKFQEQLTAINVNDIGRWLSSHSKIMPDSLHEMPVIKKLYAFAHQGLTGEPVVETVSADAFPHLVKNGHYEGAKQFFDSYPDVVQKLPLTPHQLTLLAINSGDVDTLKFILSDILKKTIGDIFSKEDIIALMKACILKGNILETQAHVFQNYNLETIDKSIRRGWGVEILAYADAETISAFHQHILLITNDMVDEAIQKSLFSNDHKKWKGLTKSKEISKSHLADTFLKYFSPADHPQASASIETALKMLIQGGLSYIETLPISGNPLLFFMPYFATLNASNPEDKILFETLLSDSLLLDYKNQEGLTLIPFLQKNFLNGQKISGYYFKTDVLSKHLETRGNHSFYQPFLEEFGQLDLLSPFCHLCPSPFQDPRFPAWRAMLTEAEKENSLPKVMEVWRKVPEPGYLNLYALKNPKDYLRHKSKNYSSDSVYDYTKAHMLTKEFKVLLEQGKYHELFPLIDLAAESGVGLLLLGELGAIPSAYEIAQECQKKIIPSYEIPKLITQPEEFLKALENGQITQSSFIEYYQTFGKNENAELIAKALPILFPNPLDLVTQKSQYGYSVFEAQILFFSHEEKTFKTLLDYGDCFSLLTQLTEECFQIFLRNSSAQLLNFVAEKSPSIFAYHDEKRNFLKMSIQVKRFQNIEFVTTHLKNLKEMYSENGIPLIFELGDDNPTLLMQIISLDPSILDLTSKEGLGIETLLDHFIPQDSEHYAQAKEFLARYRSFKK